MLGNQPRSALHEIFDSDHITMGELTAQCKPKKLLLVVVFAVFPLSGKEKTEEFLFSGKVPDRRCDVMIFLVRFSSRTHREEKKKRRSRPRSLILALGRQTQIRIHNKQTPGQIRSGAAYILVYILASSDRRNFFPFSYSRRSLLTATSLIDPRRFSRNNLALRRVSSRTIRGNAFESFFFSIARTVKRRGCIRHNKASTGILCCSHCI